MGFFDKFKISRLQEGLAKTREALFGKVQKVIFGKSKIDDQLLDDLEEILLGADVGVTTTAIIIENIRARVKKERYEDARELDPLLRSEIQKLLERETPVNGNPYTIPEGHLPHVIMIVGVNGVGKTTTIGKLAYNYQMAGNKVVIGAADTFRAAANEQLEIWAERAKVDIIKHLHGGDPAAVAFDALQSARANKANVLIIDTAGRLHTKVHLMDELKKIRKVLQKISPDVPHETLLVLDASTGQNAVQQAKQFEIAAGVTGLILTKLDGTAKGGVILAINQELHLPVKYIGVGEKIDDLQPFDGKAFVDALFEKTE
jgi:fused signal recognition particle receptor